MRRQTNHNDENFFNRRKPLRTNAVTPDIIVGPIWLHDEQPSSIEIIELNSSNEMETPRERQQTNRANSNLDSWNCVNNRESEEMEERCDAIKRARDRRRVEDEALEELASTFASNMNDYNYYPNHSTNHINEELKFNHQMNCFTIFNKHFIDSDSDTSIDGECGEVEIITSSDMILNTNNREPHDNDIYNEEIVTYGTDIDQETRTIWIYSYKNKHLISEDDFVINNPSTEMLGSSTSHSTDSSSEHTADKSTSFCRLGSPTPPTYIPRLDLSLVPTLSTVTEISERNAQPTPKESNISLDRNIKKPTNNWFLSESAKLNDSKPIRKREKATNIINWMALSPRERRRVLKDKSSSDRWVGSNLNLADNNRDNHGDRTITEMENEGVKVVVDVEVHADVNDKSFNTAVLGSKSPRTAVKSIEDDIPTVNKIKYADDICEDFQKDRGDHYVKLVVAPAIRLTPKRRKTPEITDPLETLDSSNWIHESREERVTGIYDYVLETPEPGPGVRRDSVVDQAWMRNSISFLQPSQWTAFAPITETPVSYHLSLGSIVEERQKWYKRLINFFKCCCK